MASLRSVRKRAGYSQRELAELVGTSQPNIAAYESGRKVFSMKMADRILQEIGERNATGAEIALGNRLASFKRAKGEGDLPAMLDAAGFVAKAVGSSDEALGLLGEMVSEMEKSIDDEDEDGLDGDDRDLFGRVRPAVKSADFEDDERDAFGRVIRPIEGDLDGEDEDDEDELDSDRRDTFGRRIA